MLHDQVEGGRVLALLEGVHDVVGRQVPFLLAVAGLSLHVLVEAHL